ncbi:MAG: hypothetical protein JXR76_32730 [Deltaproteobacteria bacterium]|nr:hypothetical protein [Deltaproteobacteria bacterium]
MMVRSFLIWLCLVIFCASGCNEHQRGKEVQLEGCYTPCRQSLLRDDGTYLSCSHDGLMQGCLDGRFCLNGSCVFSADDVPACATDLECPDFQRCISGRCRIECNADSNCADGNKCYRHVCRRPCNSNGMGATSGTCGQKEYCRTMDGETGFCMAMENLLKTETLNAIPAQMRGLSDSEPLWATDTNTAPEGIADTESGFQTGAGIVLDSESATDGSVQILSSEDSNLFDVSRWPVAFRNTHIAGSFKIFNYQPTAEQFVVRKVKHATYSDAGVEVVREHPLSWLEMGTDDNLQKVEELTVLVDGASDSGVPGEKQVQLGSAANDVLTQWNGELEVVHPVMGVRKVSLSYSATPDGQWSGKMFSFARFDDGGLDAWVANRHSQEALENVENALIRRWVAFKQGELSLNEFRAVLQATEDEAWKLESVDEICKAGEQGENVACYLYDNSQGYAVYTYDQSMFPIPGGMNELSLTMNLQADNSDRRLLRGKIDSERAPQYPGDPMVTLVFEEDPVHGCSDEHCLVPIVSMDAVIHVGGRYAPGKEGCTGSAFAETAVPWLIPGFLEGTEGESGIESRYYQECLETTFPFDIGDERAVNNPYISRTNPIPDGRMRSRTISLVDGAMINQNELFVIYQEQFDALPEGSTSEGYRSYGYMILSKTPAQLEEEDFVGTAKVSVDGETPDSRLMLECDAAMLNAALGPGESITRDNAWRVVSVMLNGSANEPDTQLAEGEIVHYYCEDSGLFDGGPLDSDDAPQKAACPEASDVVFFSLTGGPESLSDQPCQDSWKLDGQDRITSRGSCKTTLNEWVANGTWNIRLNPVWRCVDSSQVYCDDNRRDLRDGKVFFGDIAKEDVPFEPLPVAIANAFRYRIRFKDRENTAVGFVPDICGASPDMVPYCYDPKAIEEIARRVDCAAVVYMANGDDFPSDEDRLKVGAFLGKTFSSTTLVNPTDGSIQSMEGFEYLNAELLIMLGDDAYTESFAARLDLESTRTSTFDGAQFEPGGITISGGAGFELSTLYRAVQYYQLVIDRFFHFGKMVDDAIQNGGYRGIITGASVVTWFDRVIRASTQKSRALGEIAKRYSNFNEPTVAMQVVERAYAATYMESVVLSQLMIRVMESLAPEARAQVGKQIENAQRQYRIALLDMSDVHESISLDDNYFGFAPDYIPFPALDEKDTNAFEKILAVAREKVNIAAQKEEKALNEQRTFDVDRAAFQGELKRLQDTYERELADICGSFEGDDGLIYPAVPLYAHMSDVTAVLKDPCGLVGNGRIHETMAQMEMKAVELKSAVLAQEHILKRMDISKERIVGQCNVQKEIGAKAMAAIQRIRSAQNDHMDAITSRRAAVIDEFVSMENSQVARIMDAKQIQMRDTAWYLNQLVKDKRGSIQTIEFNTAEQVRWANDSIRDAEREISDMNRRYECSNSLYMSSLTQSVSGLLAYESIARDWVASGIKKVTSPKGNAVSSYLYGQAEDNEQYAKIEEQIQLHKLDDIIIDYYQTAGEKQKAIDALENEIEMIRRDAQNEIAGLEIELEVESRDIQTDLDCAILGLDAELDQELRRLDAQKTKELEQLDTQLQQTLRNLDTQLDIALKDLDIQLNCELAEVDFAAQVKELMLNIAENRLNILRSDYNVSLSLSEIQKLYNQVKRTLSEMVSHEQLTINIEAAKNNPNVRIYRNDAMINADTTFQRALREVYRTTKVLEYYTSQSYDRLQNLFLIRTATVGDNNLETYLADLEDEFTLFEDDYGNPDIRVAILSLRDDILDIPFIDENGNAMSEKDRVDSLRQALLSAHYIDNHGRISIPFSTVLKSLSPMTWNHRIESVEADIIASNVGDTVGRLYLKQDGTGTVVDQFGQNVFYELPERTAVLNPLFNGTRVFDATVYRNRRLSQQPLVNSHWSLIFDSHGEEANRDIDLSSLTDIRLYVYYTDFTRM